MKAHLITHRQQSSPDDEDASTKLPMRLNFGWIYSANQRHVN